MAKKSKWDRFWQTLSPALKRRMLKHGDEALMCSYQAGALISLPRHLNDVHSFCSQCEKHRNKVVDKNDELNVDDDLVRRLPDLLKIFLQLAPPQDQRLIVVESRRFALQATQDFGVPANAAWLDLLLRKWVILCLQAAASSYPEDVRDSTWEHEICKIARELVAVLERWKAHDQPACAKGAIAEKSRKLRSCRAELFISIDPILRDVDMQDATNQPEFNPSIDDETKAKLHDMTVMFEQSSMRYCQDQELSRIAGYRETATEFYGYFAQLRNDPKYQNADPIFLKGLLAIFPFLLDLFLNKACPEDHEQILEEARSSTEKATQGFGPKGEAAWYDLLLRKLEILCLQSNANQYPEEMRDPKWGQILKDLDESLTAAGREWKAHHRALATAQD